MLPLWIIDLTSNSSRKDHFVNDLLGKTKGVFIKPENATGTEASDGNVPDGDFCWYYSHYSSDDFFQCGNFSKCKELLKWDESYECEGNKLSSFNDLSDKTDEEIKEFSDKIYEFQSQLVRDGQKYVRMVRKSSLKAYTSLNVCVMGDATEEFTQLLFPSVALLLQKEKGRMLANHIHQGIRL